MEFILRDFFQKKGWGEGGGVGIQSSTIKCFDDLIESTLWLLAL